MTPIFIDFETFWSTTHSLTKMLPMEYVMHPKTEIQSAAIQVDRGPCRVIFGEENLQRWADATDFSDVILIAHNMSGFDALVASWRLGIRPKMWGCTLAMARPYYSKLGGSPLRLASLAERLHLSSPKGSLEATNTKGRYLSEFTPEEVEAMRVYNKTDTILCSELFYKLLPLTGKRELKIIDRTIRMLVDPQFECDTQLLEQTLEELIESRKEMLLSVAAFVAPKDRDLFAEGAPPEAAEDTIERARKVLASAPKFAAYLESQGVEVPMKPSPSKPDKQIPALAKTDQGLLDLLEHDDPKVCAAAAARIGVKSTLLETRINRFLTAAKYSGGDMPVALSYYGADTTGRWSGMMKLNQQNLPSVARDGNTIVHAPKNALRRCMRAPKGKKVVVADLSGIEMRVNHTLWKVPSSLELFKLDPAKADLYVEFASKSLYHIPREAIIKPQRHLGKIAQLGLGFGAGDVTFRIVAKMMGGIELTAEESTEIVSKWRAAYPEIVRGWKTCHAALKHIAMGNYGVAIDPWGLCRTMKGGIETPMGQILYPGLRRETTDTGTEWVYGWGRKKARIYAGKVTENIVQHLARHIIAGMDLDFAETPLGQKYPLALTVHDENVYVVDDEDAIPALDEVQRIMRAGVDWWPELITWSEGDIAQTYGDAK